uniref:Uncharacterized protein n=1 Tax=Talaromyces marneffei PM1 TaxID=1077442 RepID=A0A093UNC7_TALMA
MAFYSQSIEIIGKVLGGVETTSQIHEVLYSRLLRHWESLLAGSLVEGVEVLSNGVFSLQIHRDLIFKIGKDILDRWKHVKEGVSVCQARNLDLLLIPPQMLLKTTIRGVYRFVIVEQRLSLSHDYHLQSDLYQSLGSILNPALEQLVIFIIESGFSDVDFHNIPVLDKELEMDKKPRIALVDLENCVAKHELNPPVVYGCAFFGDERSIRGLLRCITPSSFERVQSVAKGEGVDLKRMFGAGYYKRALRERDAELDLSNQYRKIVAKDKNYEDFVKDIVDSLREFDIRLKKNSIIESWQLPRTSWSKIGHAPRYFRTSIMVSGKLTFFCGVIVLDADAQLLACSVLFEGTGFDPHRERLVQTACIAEL